MFEFLKKKLKAYRCPNCGKLLLKYSFKGEFLKIQIKCPRCNHYSTFEKELLPKDANKNKEED